VTLSLQTRLSDLATAVGTDIKQHRTWITGSPTGDLTTLTTLVKTDLIAAINEVNAKPSSGVTQQDLDDLRESILGPDVPEALDTLRELAAALGDDEDFAATVTAFMAAIGDPDTDFVTIYTAAKTT
jgi:hypothetical protein